MLSRRFNEELQAALCCLTDTELKQEPEPIPKVSGLLSNVT